MAATNDTTRELLLSLASLLDITEDETGDREWAYYFDAQQLADDIVRMRPEAGQFVSLLMDELL